MKRLLRGSLLAALSLTPILIAAPSPDRGASARATNTGPPPHAAAPQRVTASGRPYELRLSAVARDGIEPIVNVSSPSAFQGGAVMVTAERVVSGSVHVFGREYPLMAANGALAGFVGFGTEDPPGATTISIDVRDSNGGTYHYARPLTIRKTQWTVDYIEVPPDSGGGVLQDPNVGIREQNRLNDLYSKVTPRQWRDHWVSPIPGHPIALPTDVSGYFGEQRSFNGGPVSGHHGGTDLGLAFGTPVLAANDGTVVLAELLDVRGNMVIIDHGGGVFTGYGHMSELDVKPGDRVTQGQVIGKVGSTGLSTGAHLHWEVSVSGVLVDGLRWVDGSQGF